jgi:hypothetical protein
MSRACSTHRRSEGIESWSKCLRKETTAGEIIVNLIFEDVTRISEAT